MEVKHILFDADGVIVFAEPFSKQYQKAFGFPEDNMQPFFYNEFQPTLIGKADLKE